MTPAATFTVTLTPWRVGLLALVLVAIAATVWASQQRRGGYIPFTLGDFLAVVAWGAVLLWLVAGWLT